MMRSSLQAASREEKEMAVLGIFTQFRIPQAVSLPNDLRLKTKYCLFGQDVCRKTYTFALDIGLDKLYALSRHYDINGLKPRIHKNTKRLPKNTHSLETNLNVRTFIENYAEENAIILPGRTPGLRETDNVCLLPSAESKRDIWKLYVQSCQIANIRSVCYVTFCSLWKELIPWIIVSKPMTDLCWKCQSNNYIIFRSVNQNEESKMKKLNEQIEHIAIAKKERVYYYQTQSKQSGEFIQKNKIDFHSPSKPCSLSGSVHYSWDYAQQLHYPCDPQQPGPIYFKTPRKCGIFGVCIDGFPMQFNYLIDESVATGKGANTTISYVHDFFKNHGAGETNAQFHADNCSGQNKNNMFIHYMLWRVINELHFSIEYSFLIAGHTKFSCDQCFGTMKTKIKKTPVWTIKKKR